MLEIILHICQIVVFFSGLQKPHFWNHPQQPSLLVKVWSLFGIRVIAWVKINGLSLTEGLLFFSFLPLTKYASKSYSEGRAISCKCHSSTMNIFIYILPIPHQKAKSFSILEPSGEETWIEDPTTSLVRYFFLCFLRLSYHHFLLFDMQAFIVHSCSLVSIITPYN